MAVHLGNEIRSVLARELGPPVGSAHTLRSRWSYFRGRLQWCGWFQAFMVHPHGHKSDIHRMCGVHVHHHLLLLMLLSGDAVDVHGIDAHGHCLRVAAIRSDHSHWHRYRQRATVHVQRVCGVRVHRPTAGIRAA